MSWCSIEGRLLGDEPAITTRSIGPARHMMGGDRVRSRFGARLVPSASQCAHRAEPVPARRPHHRVMAVQVLVAGIRSLVRGARRHRCAGRHRAGDSVHHPDDEHGQWRHGRRRRLGACPSVGRRPARRRQGAGAARPGAGGGRCALVFGLFAWTALPASSAGSAAGRRPGPGACLQPRLVQWRGGAMVERLPVGPAAGRRRFGHAEPHRLRAWR